MEKERILLVMPAEMRKVFGKLASAEDLDWAGVESFQEARAVLDHSSVAVVVSDVSLPDGNWYFLLEEILSRGDKTNLTVALPGGSDSSSVKSCGVAVVHCPPDPGFGRRLARAAQRAGNSGAIQ